MAGTSGKNNRTLVFFFFNFIFGFVLAQAPAEVESPRDAWRKKIAQLMIVYVDSHSDSGALRKVYAEQLKKTSFAGVIFENTAADATHQGDDFGKYTNGSLTGIVEIRKIASKDLFIAEDYFHDLDPVQPKDIGEANSESCALLYGYFAGLRMSSLGYNVLFGPIVESFQPETTAYHMGYHANKKLYFGTDRERLKKILPNVVHGLYLGGVIPTMKHFPYVPTTFDPHYAVGKSLRSTQEVTLDLELTADLSCRLSDRNEEPMVMSTHTYNPLIDDSIATFSHVWIREKLRTAIEERGLVMTDGLFMGGLYKKHFLNLYRKELLGHLPTEGEKTKIIGHLVAGYSPSTHEAFKLVTSRFAQKAILAGHDLILLEGGPRVVNDVLETLVTLALENTDNGKSFRENIDASVKRVSAYKKKHIDLLSQDNRGVPYETEHLSAFRDAMLAKNYAACPALVEILKLGSPRQR